MNKLKRHYKKEINKVSLSSSFMARCRCSRCSGVPNIYYYIHNTTPYPDPKTLQNVFAIISKRARRMGSDHYLTDSPKEYTSLSEFSQGTGFKRYDPKIHYTRGLNLGFYVTEYLMCDCGHTMLAFTQKSAKGRPEITMRKSHKNFPKRFVY